MWEELPLCSPNYSRTASNSFYCMLFERQGEVKEGMKKWKFKKGRRKDWEGWRRARGRITDNITSCTCTVKLLFRPSRCQLPLLRFLIFFILKFFLIVFSLFFFFLIFFISPSKSFFISFSFIRFSFFFFISLFLLLVSKPCARCGSGLQLQDAVWFWALGQRVCVRPGAAGRPIALPCGVEWAHLQDRHRAARALWLVHHHSAAGQVREFEIIRLGFKLGQ